MKNVIFIGKIPSNIFKYRKIFRKVKKKINKSNNQLVSYKIFIQKSYTKLKISCVTLENQFLLKSSKTLLTCEKQVTKERRKTHESIVYY